MITYQKALASSNDGTVIANAREGLVRETGIGTDWLACRIGAFISFVGLSDDNGVPTAEQVTLSNIYNDIHFGMIDSDTVPPGQVGSRYIGVGMNLGQNPSISQYSPPGDWRVGSSVIGGAYSDANMAIVRTDGATHTRSGAITARKIAGCASPVGDTDYCSFLCISLFLNAAASVTLGVTGTGNISDTSYTNLMMKILSPPTTFATNSLGTGGWWSPGVTPVGLDKIYIRFPFFNSRLRVHNIAITRTL